jgi:hypothetical protein
LRWENGVDQDIRILGVKNWKKVALDRDEWEKLLRRPGPTKGCRANDDDEIRQLVNELPAFYQSQNFFIWFQTPCELNSVVNHRNPVRHIC